MVGRPIPEPRSSRSRRAVPCRCRPSRWRRGATAPRTLKLHGGEILGLAGVSGNGQTALADLVSGLVARAAARSRCSARRSAIWTAPTMVAHGIARIPEDRQAEGLIADMSVTENVIAERYREPPFSQRGLIDWRGCASSPRIIVKYDVRCPGPQAAMRLLSGGNMQKLILGRAMALQTALHPRLPADARPGYRCGRLCASASA